MSSPDRTIHYGWHIVWAGTFCVFACLGLGRFALGMILPAMGRGLELSYSQMGLIGTMNFVGYLAAVLFCGALAERLGYRLLITMALGLIGSTMILIGQSSSLPLILLLYALCGMGSGAANVPMMGLIAHWFHRSQRGRATGFVVIGSGFAILLSGKLIPFLNDLAGEEFGWRLSWQVLGGIILLVALLCLAVLRNSPRDKGLRPYGEKTGPGEPAGAPEESRISPKIIAHLGAIYFLFGYTYVIYATFIVTTLINEHGFSPASAGNFWAVVGLLSLLSGPLFGTLSDHIGRRKTLALVFAIQTTAYLLVAVHPPPALLLLSITCFGLVAWAIPSIMAAMVGDYAGPFKAARIFGLITFIFAIGQIAGPAMAGVLAENSGSFAGSFLMAGLCTILGMLLALRLRPLAS
ncbi:MFS transporter [Desulfurivibrio sp. C05AmB]|uniref:MFS transporter n=1 Tax=Desulfurivibrio sp. C05AmB TaxID=3374371 RepID=UPI00376ED474